MTTAQDFIDSSAKMAGILAEGGTLEAGVNADALTRFNRMLSRWQNDGVDLGIDTPLAASDTVYVDEADEECIETQLALRLMVRHNRPILPGFSASGREMYTELQGKYALVPEMPLDRALTRKYLPRKAPLNSTVT